LRSNLFVQEAERLCSSSNGDQSEYGLLHLPIVVWGVRIV